jgi:glycosyltransferase involved in cell wall biosynthesis
MKRPTVYYAWNYLETGGAQIYILSLIKRVVHEFDVVVVLPRGTDSKFLSFFDAYNVTYEFFDGHLDTAPASSIKRKISRRLTKVRSEFAMLRKLSRFDLSNSIVQIDLAPEASFTALVWLCLRTTVFTVFHNSFPKVEWWREALWRIRSRLIARFTSFNALCANEEACQYFRQHLGKGIGERIAVARAAIDPEEINSVLAKSYDHSMERERMGIGARSIVILGVGQFIDRKGRWVFLDAAKRAIAQNPDLAFVWLTPSLPPADDMERIKGYGLGESFKLILSETVGTKREEVLRFFRIADVFALPSYVEGLPIAILEAMALGLPVISTRINAIPEAIEHMKTGVLIEPGQPGSLAQEVLRLAADEELRSELGKSARRLALEKFDESRVAELVISRYKKALARKI